MQAECALQAQNTARAPDANSNVGPGSITNSYGVFITTPHEATGRNSGIFFDGATPAQGSLASLNDISVYLPTAGTKFRIQTPAADPSLSISTSGFTVENGTGTELVVGGRATSPIGLPYLQSRAVANGGAAYDLALEPAGGVVRLGPGSVQLPGSTVACLAPCNASNDGVITYVTDAASPAYNAALTGGGSVRTLSMCNGTAWMAH